MGPFFQTLAAFCLLLTSIGAGHSQAASSDNALETGVLRVSDAETSYDFAVEIADTNASRARGLMFRESMAPDAGMLFIYPESQIASFWMKNTLIPLDMIFIRETGEVVQIAREAVPGSLKSIRSDMPVRAVLEINGGLAEALDIEVGDRVTLFRQRAPR